MNSDERLPEDLWCSIFPAVRFYANYVGPSLLILFLVLLILHWFNKGLLANQMGAAASISILSWLYYGEYRKLRGKQPIGIGGGIGVAPSDSIGWAKLVVWLGMAVHLAFTLGAALWLLVSVSGNRA